MGIRNLPTDHITSSGVSLIDVNALRAEEPEALRIDDQKCGVFGGISIGGHDVLTDLRLIDDYCRACSGRTSQSVPKC